MSSVFFFFSLLDTSNMCMALECGACIPSYFAWLHSACFSSQHVKQLTDDVCFGFKKPITWAKKKLTGLRSHGRPVLIAQDITEVEVTHPQVGVVNTPTMIMMNLQRNTVLRMTTVNSANPPPRRHGTTVTTAAALADITLLATPRRTQGPPALLGHTPKTLLFALTAEALRLHKGGVVQTPVLPREAPGIQGTSLVIQPLDTTTVLEEGARDRKEIAQPPRGRIPLQQGLNHSSSPLRAMLVSNGQAVRVNLGDIQALNHLMAPNQPSNRVHNNNNNNNSRNNNNNNNNNSNNNSNNHHRNTTRPLRPASPTQLLQELDQHNSSLNPAKPYLRDASPESGLQLGRQLPQQ